MAQPSKLSPKPLSTSGRSAEVEGVVRGRYGAEMFRRQGVWRCPACGAGPDCCGW